MERETRFELATLALARRCSTTELLPLIARLSIPGRPKRGQTAAGAGFPASSTPTGNAHLHPTAKRAARRGTTGVVLPNCLFESEAGSLLLPVVHRALKHST